MAGIFDILTGLLLLLPFVKTGINGEDNLILAGRGYDIRSPCDGQLDLICFVIWQISLTEKSAYIAVVSNGEIQTVKSKAMTQREGLKCALHIKNLTTEDVGRFRCQQRQNISPLNTPSSVPESGSMSGQTVSLHCVLLKYGRYGRCFTRRHRAIRLKWVDEAGDDIQEDSQHLIKRQSPCNVILSVALQREDDRKFRCQATVDQEVKISERIPVRVPVRKGRGRGMMIEPHPENKDGKQEVIGVAVGVVGCVALTAMAALFALNRRRANSQAPDAPCDTTNADNDLSADDVTYADIHLPTGSERVRESQFQPTIYASIRTVA